MGSFGTSNSNSARYVSIKHGGFCNESKQAREGFTPITVFNPRTKTETVKHVQMFGFIEGYVTNIEWYDTGHKYEFRLLGYKISIDTGQGIFILDIGANSPAFSTFAKQAENIDFAEEVKFMAWGDTASDGKSKNAFLMKQGGVTIPFKYKKDDMGDCPLPTVHEFDGSKDYGAQKAFFKRRIESVVIPRCNAAQAIRDGKQPPVSQPPPPTFNPPAQATASQGYDSMDDDMDIPF